MPTEEMLGREEPKYALGPSGCRAPRGSLVWQAASILTHLLEHKNSVLGYI